jgi:hypothetical protein
LSAGMHDRISIEDPVRREEIQHRRRCKARCALFYC